MAIDWGGGGYTVAAWRLYRVDIGTWADLTEVPRVTSVSVSRDVSNEHGTIEQGSIEVDTAVGEDFAEGYYRIVMIAEQDGEHERVEIATLLCNSTSSTTDRAVTGHRINGKSVLQPASTTILTLGSYAPAGTNGAEWAAQLLSSAINAPVEVDGGFTLDTSIVFDEGSTVLEAVWTVLDAGNHVMQIAGNGVVTIRPMPTTPSLDLDAAHARLTQTEFQRDLDYGNVPNRYFATENGVSSAAVNNDPTSITSTVYRGWYSDVLDTSPTRVDGESLFAYCERKLEEASMVEDKRTYSREWWPDVLPFSMVHGSLSSVGFDGDFRVVSQQLTCNRGIVVEERSRREVYAWRRT